VNHKKKNILRTVAGLALQQRCTIIHGFSFGSCTYIDICNDVVKHMCGMTESNCSPKEAYYGVDCNYPFNISPQSLNELFKIDVQDFTSRPSFSPFFFIPGDFNIKISVISALDQHVACFRFLYTMQKT
jgi:hypothetical protein